MVAGEIETFGREFLEIMPSAAHAAAVAGGADEDAVLQVAERFMDTSTDDGLQGTEPPTAAVLSHAPLRTAAGLLTTAATAGGVQSPAASADARWLAIRNIVATATDPTALLPTRARAAAKLLELEVPLDVDVDSFCAAMRSLSDEVVPGSAGGAALLINAAALRTSTAERLIGVQGDCRATALTAVAQAVTAMPTTTSDVSHKTAALHKTLAHLIGAGMQFYARGPSAVHSVRSSTAAPCGSPAAVTVEGVDAVASASKGAPLLQWCSAACVADGSRGIARFARSAGVPVINAVAAMAIAGCEFTTAAVADTDAAQAASGSSAVGATETASVDVATKSVGAGTSAEKLSRPAVRLAPTGSTLAGMEEPAVETAEAVEIERAVAAALERSLDASVLPLLSLPLPASGSALKSPVDGRPLRHEDRASKALPDSGVKAVSAASTTAAVAASMTFDDDSDASSDTAPAAGLHRLPPTSVVRPRNSVSTPAPRLPKAGAKVVRFHGASPAASAAAASESVSGHKRSHAEMAGRAGDLPKSSGPGRRAGAGFYGHSVWNPDADVAPQTAGAARDDAMWGEVLHGPGRASAKPRLAVTYSRSSMGVWKTPPKE